MHRTPMEQEDTMVTALLATLALHGAPAPPRPAVYSRPARNVSYERRMLLDNYIPAVDGRGWVAPMPYPHRRKKHR